MSSQNTPLTSTKRLSTAIAMVLVGTSTSTYAVNFGQTNIQSAQYEPLSATIMVNDIGEGDFNVALANRAIYQQMGLSPNSNITATFQRTSSNSGKIVLRSSQPINEPFADIVLDINNSNKKQFMPKTLLMPMGKNAEINLRPQNVVASTTTPKLPTTISTPIAQASAVESSSNEKIQTSNVVTPMKSAVNDIKKSEQEKVNSTKGIPEGEFAEATRKAFLVDKKDNSSDLVKEKTTQNQNNDNQEKTQNKAKVTTKQPATKQPQTAPTKAAVSKDSKADKVSKNKTADIVAKDSVKKTLPAPVKTNEPAIGKLQSDRFLLEDIKKEVVAKNTTKDKAPTKNKTTPVNHKPKTNPEKKTSAKASGKSTYVVQRNDNLWTIANEIAKKNNTQVHTVMKEIQENNPDAFINGHANQLLVNKTLVLPDYDVIPSQKSLQEAIAAKRKTKSAKAKQTTTKAKSKYKAKPTKAKTTVKTKTKKPAPKAPRSQKKHIAKSAPKVQQKSTKPKVSLVAPGTSQKASNKKATGSSNKQLVAKLKNSRKTTAKRASRVRKLNSQVSSYTQKLKLQNKKLAELEARLKKLKGQK